MQTQFTHNGLNYTRTQNSKGGYVHKAGPKFIKAEAYAEALAQVEANNTGINAPASQPATVAPVSANTLLDGIVTATAPAPSPANPFGALLALGTAAQAAAPKAASTPRVKAPQVNGVARPSKPGACLSVWAICDAITAEGKTPTIGMVKAQGAAQGLDATTVQVQYYRWRKHQGISGRL